MSEQSQRERRVPQHTVVLAKVLFRSYIRQIWLVVTGLICALIMLRSVVRFHLAPPKKSWSEAV